MYPVSADFHNLSIADAPTSRVRIYFIEANVDCTDDNDVQSNGTLLCMPGETDSNGRIEKGGVTINEFFNSDANVQIGATVSSQIGMTLINRDGALDGFNYGRCKVYIDVYDDTNSTWLTCPMGVYNIAIPKRRKVQLVSATGYDQMQQLDEIADSWWNGLDWSNGITLLQIIQSMAATLGIHLSANTSANIVNSGLSYTEIPFTSIEMTYRDILSYIAETTGTIARFDRNGALDLRWFSDAVLSTDTQTYAGGLVTFTATDRASISSLSVPFSPIQDLHGYDYPSPENICPISGRTGVDAFVAPNVSMWSKYKLYVDTGAASELMPVGKQITDTWENTNGTEVSFPWDVVHYTSGGDAFLKLHYAAPEALQFDAPEAIYYFEGTETAGTYHIPIGSAYGTGWVVGHSIQFTLTAAPDEGDQLFIDCGTNYANDPAGGRAWRVYDAGGTTVKQSGTTSEGTGGTSLGTIGNVNAHRTNGRLCAISRVVYGYARWSQSAMRQYFNSADVNWWTMKNPWDRPPAQASTIRGFLCGFSQDFLDHLEETEVVTALNTQEGFAEATETTLDKIFLPSLEQMYINPQLAGVEGESWDYYKALAEEAGLPGKFQQKKTYPILISYNASNTSSAVIVFLRSCGRGYASSEWLVHTSGYVGTNYAYSAFRGCPACKFKKSTPNGVRYNADWTSAAGTVYGGTMDVVSGLLTVDWASISSYAGETLPGAWISDRDVYAPGTSPTTGAQVVYELATPLTYQLTPTQVAVLTGTNNVWSTGDSVSVTVSEPNLVEIQTDTVGNQCLSIDVGEYQVSQIDALSVKASQADVGVTIGSGGNAYTILDNPMLFGDEAAITTKATPIYNRLSAFRLFTPISMRCIMDWSIEAGDIITVTNESVTYDLPIFQQRLRWRGGYVVSDLFSSGEQERPTQSKEIRSSFRSKTQMHEFEVTLEQLRSYIQSVDGNYTLIQQTVDAITQTVANQNVTIQNILDPTGEIWTAITKNTSNLSSIEDSLNNEITERRSYIRFIPSEPAIVMGVDEDNEIKLKLVNNIIYFFNGADDSTDLSLAYAYFNSQEAFADRFVAGESVQIGTNDNAAHWLWKKLNNGDLVLELVG